MGLENLSILNKPLNGIHFRAKTIKYHPANAEFLGFMSNLVYQKTEEDILEVLKDEHQIKNFKHQKLRFIENKKTDTQALVISDDKKVIVAFRGTTSRKDWQTNINYTLIQPDDMFGQVHEGFYNSLQSVWAEVVEVIEDFKKGDYKSLWFTGHSLGGALANLAVAALIQEDYPVYGLYTFGQPRVGDRAFARTMNAEFKDRYFLFINDRDIVTRVPTRKMGYSHAGNLLYFDEEGNLHNDLHWWFTFQHRVNTSGVLTKLLQTFGDHSMAGSYYPLLQKHNNHNPFLQW
jgi:triacylglycerol lipase